MVRKIILFINTSLLIVATFVCSNVMAQQEPQFTQYMFNRLSYNPGYAGSNGAICATAFYRNQWMGLKLTDPSGSSTGASPGETMNISIDLPVKILHGGLGATIISDKIGFWNNIYFKLDYAFRFQLPTGNLAIGIEGQMFNGSLDMDKLQPGDSWADDDTRRETLDRLLVGKSGKTDDMLFDLGLGIYYQVPGRLYLGAAVSKLMQTKSSKLNWDNRRFYYILAGYEWTVPDYPSWRILPSALLKTDFASSDSYQLDASALIEYEHKIWAGASYRINDAVMILAGVTFKDFKIGVSYDAPTSRLSTQASGSLEVFARYCFKIESSPDAPTIYRNTIKM